MNNTDKLLRAFIEASGFEIKEIKIPLEEIKTNGALTLSPVDGACSIDYKVTKKVHKSTVNTEREYTRRFCYQGGDHKNSYNACGGNYGMCSKCNESILYVDGEWMSK